MPDDDLTPDPDTLDADDALAGLTDEEWRVAHEALRGLGIPDAQLAYVWAPGVTAEEVGL